jgi:aminopeptidase N
LVSAVSASGTNDDQPLAAALKALLSDHDAEPAYVAQAVMLPSEADIAREIGRDVDPDAILAARRKLRASIGEKLYAILSDTYGRMHDNGPYSPAAPSAGKRALKNACLDLLAATGRPDAIALAMRQFETADNMTDRMAALATLSLHDVPERQTAFDAFYARYAADPLIVDKWLAQQAAIPEAGTLDRVRALTQHPAFSFSNPNRVRSLIGTFAQANQTQFNRPDGAGYDFVADTVLALDAKNPQLASRILSAFKSWRALEPVRRARAEAALQRIAQIPALSSDIRDIVDRALTAD